MSEKLKPCPWCHDDEHLFDCAYGGDDDVKNPYSVACRVCNSCGPAERTQEAARIAWNRRHQEQETTSEFERLLSK